MEWHLFKPTVKMNSSHISNNHNKYTLFCRNRSEFCFIQHTHTLPVLSSHCALIRSTTHLHWEHMTLHKDSETKRRMMEESPTGLSNSAAVRTPAYMSPDGGIRPWNGSHIHVKQQHNVPGPGWISVRANNL